MIENLIIISSELVDQELQIYFGKLPSCMVPLHRHPVIDYTYHENYNHYKNIYLLLGKETSLVKEYIDDSQLNIEIIYITESKSLIHSLQYALNTIENAEETTIIFGYTYFPYMSSLLEIRKTK